LTALFRSRLPLTVREAINWNRKAGPQRKTLIVLHCMQWPSKLDTAEWCGRFFAGLEGPAPVASANFCVDGDSVVQSVPAEMWAYHAPGGNPQGIGVEHPGFVSWTREQWLAPKSEAALRMGARLVAELCEHFQIPCEFLDADDVRAKLAGITTHEHVAIAYPERNPHPHKDPGRGFPLREYLDWVRSYTSSAWAEV
jgi:N-acetylmuramoyl-L-alanine amidase